MDNISIVLSLLNNSTNTTCSTPLLWTEHATDRRAARLYVCILAFIIHIFFWSQLLCCRSIRQKSMQWIYAYLIVDILLLFRFFFVHIVRTTSTECEPSRLWVLFMCYFEATVDNYLNILQVYILLVLNICRYVQVAYNRNVYRLYKKTLALTHIGIYLLSFLFVFFQFFFDWTKIVEYVKDRCDATYTNFTIQIFNIIFAFALPIGLNILVICASVYHVNVKSTSCEEERYISARDKYNRTLVIQFLVFYTIWLALWSPNIIVYQMSFSSRNLTIMVRLLNFTRITLDPFIIVALDDRFWHAWKNVLVSTRISIIASSTNHGRVGHTTMNPVGVSVKARRLEPTHF